MVCISKKKIWQSRNIGTAVFYADFSFAALRNSSYIFANSTNVSYTDLTPNEWSSSYAFPQRIPASLIEILYCFASTLMAVFS